MSTSVSNATYWGTYGQTDRMPHVALHRNESCSGSAEARSTEALRKRTSNSDDATCNSQQAMQERPGSIQASIPCAASEPTEAASTRPAHLGVAKRYAIAALACALFALVYAQFSHDVYSPFMTFMFAIPLVAGAMPAALLGLAKTRAIAPTARRAWGLGIASLTIASCLRGVFDIAGTSSPYLPAYIVIAALCAAISCIAQLRNRARA